MHIKTDAIKKLEAFKLKEKFNEDSSVFYPGLADPGLKPEFTKLMNTAADDFEYTAKNKPTEEKFIKNIKTGLSRFNQEYGDHIDTEDEERIGRYFEELMDCVGLESSGGALNDWRYGFDPTH